MKKRIDCQVCGKKDLDKNTIGINKKLLGDALEDFYCIECLAEYLDCSVQDIMDKIEEFKESGCTLFS